MLRVCSGSAAASLIDGNIALVFIAVAVHVSLQR
jgi:hypothetical protein